MQYLQEKNIFNKNAGLQVFSWQYYKIFENSYTEEHLKMAASENFSFYASLNVFLHEQTT